MSENKKMIENIILHVTVINMDELGCPRLNQLYTKKDFPSYIFHIDINPYKCTYYKVHALKKWYVIYFFLTYITDNIYNCNVLGYI
jgi:hypothetical protein